MKYPSYLEAYIHSISPEQKRGKGWKWLAEILGALLLWVIIALVPLTLWAVRP